MTNCCRKTSLIQFSEDISGLSENWGKYSPETTFIISIVQNTKLKDFVKIIRQRSKKVHGEFNFPKAIKATNV